MWFSFLCPHVCIYFLCVFNRRSSSIAHQNIMFLCWCDYNLILWKEKLPSQIHEQCIVHWLHAAVESWSHDKKGWWQTGHGRGVIMFPINSVTMPDRQLANAVKTANIHDKLRQWNLLLCQDQSVCVTETVCRLSLATDGLNKTSLSRNLKY